MPGVSIYTFRAYENRWAPLPHRYGRPCYWPKVPISDLENSILGRRRQQRDDLRAARTGARIHLAPFAASEGQALDARDQAAHKKGGTAGVSPFCLL